MFITKYALLLSIIVSSTAYAATEISIEKAITDCIAAGNKIPTLTKPSEGETIKKASLIGMAYLNYIYQNDILNPHFCESMLLMNKQIPINTKNPYTMLFTQKNAAQTMTHLADIQLCFDYSIHRSQPPEKKVVKSIQILDSIMK